MGILSKLWKRSSPSLEDQLAHFATVGIVMLPGRSIDDLTEMHSREEFEARPYKLLGCALGGEIERPPGGRFSNNLWHFDTECIEDHGDYVRIAERVRDMSGGALPIQSLRDHVDLEAGVAWLEMELDGQHLRFDCQVNNDWVDEGVFGFFIERLRARRAPGALTYLDLQGQDCLIGYATTDQLERLRELTNLDWQWL